MSLGALEVIRRGLEKLRSADNRLNPFIDSTLLKQKASISDAVNLVRESSELGFRCTVLPSHIVSVLLRRRLVPESCLAATIGFPLGSASTRAKIEESRDVLEAGAREIDLVANLWLEPREVQEEISSIVSLADRYGAIVKVIIEAPLLSDGELEALVEAVYAGGASFVKTSTGVYTKGGDPQTVMRVYRVARRYGLKVKAAGGIRTALDAIIALGAGADVIGTSSARLVMETLNSLL